MSLCGTPVGKRWHQSVPDRETVPSFCVVGPTEKFASLCAEAGVEFKLGKPPQSGTKVHYTQSMKLNALRQYVDATLPVMPSHDGYIAWRNTQPGPLPV